MHYRINREESEEVVRKLAEPYQKCFFVDPKMRRPLKNNILADLQKNGFPAAYDLLSAGLDWYQSHFGYQYSLQAGARRIDLTGKEVSTVTEQEHASAQKKIRDDQQKLAERNSMNATRTTASLHSAGRITDDQLKKLDASPMPAVPTTRAKAAAAPSAISPELLRLHEALLAANAAATGPGDAELRAAMGAAALGFIVKEAQRLIDITTTTGREEKRNGKLD